MVEFTDQKLSTRLLALRLVAYTSSNDLHFNDEVKVIRWLETR